LAASAFYAAGPGFLKSEISDAETQFLLEAFGMKAGQVIVFGGIADLDGIAAHFTIFDIDLIRNGKVQDHGDLFAAVRAHESVFHGAIGYDRV